MTSRTSLRDAAATSWSADGVEVGVLLRAVGRLGRVEHRVEALAGHLHDDAPEHLDEAPVGVPAEALVAGQGDQAVQRGLVEAQVEDRVHHARHGELGARPHAHEERVGGVAEALAGLRLDRLDGLEDVVPQPVGQLLAGGEVVVARLGGDGEAGRHRQARVGHLGEAGALAAEQVAHPRVALGPAASEGVDVALGGAVRALAGNGGLRTWGLLRSLGRVRARRIVRSVRLDCSRGLPKTPRRAIIGVMTEPLDFERFVRLPRLSGLHLSPDGARLVVTVAQPHASGTKMASALWAVDPAGQAPPRRLTRSAAGEGGAAFVPDGSLVFGSARPDPDAKEAEADPPAALWHLPADGGEARLLLVPHGGVDGVATARSGRRIAFVAPLFGGAESLEADAARAKSRKEAGLEALLFEGYPIRYWDHYLGPRERHAFVLDLPASEADAGARGA